jgi:hypothetical protein
MKPRPRPKELVVDNPGRYDRLLKITASTPDAYTWIGREAPEFGVFTAAPRLHVPGYLVVAGTYDIGEVVAYLRSYNDEREADDTRLRYTIICEKVRSRKESAMSPQMPRVIKVVVEYSPEQRRVIVRGAWPEGAVLPEPLAPSHTQNVVSVFEGVDMKWHVGFAGLVPE